MKRLNRLPFTRALRFTLMMGSILLITLGCNLANQVLLNSPAETSTPTPAPTATVPGPSGQESVQSAGCYLGVWEATNIGELITPFLAENNVQDAKDTGSSGTLTLTFTPGGQMTFVAEQYHSLFSGKLSFIPVTVDVLFDGNGSSDYSLDSASRVLISNSNFSGITYSVKVGGVTVVPATPLNNLMPALQSLPSGQAIQLDSTCSGDSLSFDSGIASMPPLLFQRIL